MLLEQERALLWKLLRSNGHAVAALSICQSARCRLALALPASASHSRLSVAHISRFAPPVLYAPKRHFQREFQDRFRKPPELPCSKMPTRHHPHSRRSQDLASHPPTSTGSTNPWSLKQLKRRDSYERVHRSSAERMPQWSATARSRFHPHGGDRDAPQRCD